MTNAVKLTLPEATLTGMTLAYHAQERPDKMAVISNYGNRTFAELNARANQLARVFRDAGLKPDDGGGDVVGESSRISRSLLRLYACWVSSDAD